MYVFKIYGLDSVQTWSCSNMEEKFKPWDIIIISNALREKGHVSSSDCYLSPTPSSYIHTIRSIDSIRIKSCM